MSKNWIRLMIITAAVIVIAAIAYAVYLLIISDTRVKKNFTGYSAPSTIIELSANSNKQPCDTWRVADGV